MKIDPVLIHRRKDLGLDREVYEKDRLRWLSFGDGSIQSIIDLDDPGALHSPVTRAMLAVLLFMPEPRRVLLLGAGGGSLARYFYHRQPDIQGEAVEVSNAIAEIANRYFECPGEEQGWRTFIGDARDYIARCEQRYDLVFLDIGDQGENPAWIVQPDILQQCRSLLNDNGALVINIIQDTAENFARALWNIRQAFDLCTVCISVPDHKNILVFAFNGVSGTCELSSLEAMVPALIRKWGLEFDQFLARIKEVNPPGSGVI